MNRTEYKANDWRRYGNNPEAALIEATLAASACDYNRLEQLNKTINRMLIEKAEEQLELRCRKAEVQI